jgi:methylthioribose-1-phosphate isomerase
VASDASPRNEADPSADGPSGGADVGRRRFFRQFAGEIINTAATVVGAAGAIQRTTAEAAAAILDPESGAARIAAGAMPTDAPTGFRSAFRWDGDRLIMIDQRRLPAELVEYEARSAADVSYAIRDMVVRGAPAIGQVAAIGLALSANRLRTSKPYARQATLRGAATGLRKTRPTAVNLGWAVDRMLAAYQRVGMLDPDGDRIADALWAEAEAIVAEATEDHGRLATAGLDLLPDRGEEPLGVLTHCNTGPLACGQFGTALGVIAAAHHAGRSLQVWVDETRPYLQGARLTAWELAQAGVPHTLIADSAAASAIAAGKVDVVLVGADRVAANGDTANKTGTYPVAVLAARHGVPFYVVAPMTSFDPSLADGTAIPIEQRSPDEVTKFRGAAVAPAGTVAWNPAFDVTPAELVTAFVTDEGILRPPFGPAIAAAFERYAVRRPGAVRPPEPAVAEAPPSPAAAAAAADPAAERAAETAAG